MDDLTTRIEKALEGRLRTGTLPATTTKIRKDVIDLLDEIADDSGTTTEEIIWKAIRLYLSAYQNTRRGPLPPRRFPRVG